MLSIAVISIDILSAKGDAVKLITPDAAVVRMCDSTSIGYRKGADLTKDIYEGTDNSHWRASGISGTA